MIFIGDQPSKKNLDPNVPFVGTNSYKTLLGWIAEMDVDVTRTYLGNVKDISLYNGKWPTLNRTDLSLDIETYDKVVALGKSAEKHLTNLGISYFALPHPSGLNRKLNDKKWIKNELKKCSKWLCQGT